MPTTQQEDQDLLGTLMSSQGSSVKPFCARSDPRMNRALEARLHNPALTLFQCLCIGGFDFHEDDAAELDSENVTLAQRKNQLNRRLRALRKRVSGSNKTSTTIAAASAGEKKKNPAPEEKQEAVAANQILRADADTISRDSLAAVADGIRSTAGLSGEQQVEAVARVLGVSAPHTQGDSFRFFNSYETLPNAGGPFFSVNQPIAPTENPNNCLSIFSLPTPVGNGGVTLQEASLTNAQEELLSSLNSNLSVAAITNSLDNSSSLAGGPIPNMPIARDSDILLSQNTFAPAQQQNTFAPAQQLSQFGQIGGSPASLLQSFLESQNFQMNSMGTHAGGGRDSRKEEALRLFQQDIQSLYDTCMARAGFFPEERVPNSGSYRAFVVAASEQEWRRRRASNDIGGQR